MKSTALLLLVPALAVGTAPASRCKAASIPGPTGASATRPPTPDPTYGLKAEIPGPGEKPVGANARWIWTAKVSDNQRIALRRKVSIADIPKKGILLVTADDFFTAYVNGTEVGHSSPDPANTYVWRDVRRYDVTKQLKTGDNLLAIQGTNAGGQAGVIACLSYIDGDQPKQIVTGADWKASEKLDPGWEQPGFDDKDWAKASDEAGLTGGVWDGSMSNWPGLTGGSSYLRRLDLPVAKVLSVDPHDGKIDGADSLVGPGPAALKITPAPAGSTEAKCPSVTLDFGQDTSGRVDITNASADAIKVALRYGESEDEAHDSPYNKVQMLDIAAGEVGHGVDSAFRYAIVTVLSGPAEGVTIRRIRLNMAYYPVEYRGAFDCSDPLLTRIWYVGAYTAHLCMQQDIWDAPKRDRARWMGDLHVSGEVINNAFLDRFLMEQTMERLRAEAGTPPTGHVNGIPGYSCAWVAGMADFLRHTGDLAYIERHHDDLVQMLDFFKKEINQDGVFANRLGKWDYVDWSPGFNGGGPHSLAATHFFMVYMLREGAWMLDQIKDPGNAARFRAWAEDAIKAAQDHLLDKASNTFGDRWQDNAMAIHSGTATAAEKAAIWDKVLSHPYPVNEMITPYYNNYCIFAMGEAGHTGDALQFIRDYWGGMIQEGATTFWEGYDTRWPKEHFHRFLQADNGQGYFVSLCHGWSSGATNFLTERILGVRSTGPGFATVEIQPELCGLEWASGTVPTPTGDIKVRVAQKGQHIVLDVNLPRGVTAHTILPGKVTQKIQGQHIHAEAVVPG